MARVEDTADSRSTVRRSAKHSRWRRPGGTSGHRAASGERFTTREGWLHGHVPVPSYAPHPGPYREESAPDTAGRPHRNSPSDITPVITPAELRETILPEEQHSFGEQYRAALDAAARTLRLDELESFLAHWRRIARSVSWNGSDAWRALLTEAERRQSGGEPLPGVVPQQEMEERLRLGCPPGRCTGSTPLAMRWHRLTRCPPRQRRPGRAAHR